MMIVLLAGTLIGAAVGGVLFGPAGFILGATLGVMMGAIIVLNAHE